jgi:hypothetical protein
MKATAWLLMIGAVVQLAVCGPAAAYIASDRIELTIDVAVQSGAGTTQIHCRESGVVEGYAKKEWWLAVPAPAVAAPEPGQNSGMVVACGAGERQGTPADSMDDGQAPELNAEITTVTRLNRKGEDERNLEMDVSISLLKRSGLEESGQPAYTSTELRRTLSFSCTCGFRPPPYPGARRRVSVPCWSVPTWRKPNSSWTAGWSET